MKVIISGVVAGALLERVVSAMPGGTVVIPEEFVEAKVVSITATYEPLHPPVPASYRKEPAPWSKKGRRAIGRRGLANAYPPHCFCCCSCCRLDLGSLA